MEPTLSEQEETQLTRLIEVESNAAIIRRANILLLDHQGLSLEDIATQLDLSVRTVKYWLGQYQKKGMKIFPDASLALVSTEADRMPRIEIHSRNERLYGNRVLDAVC